MNELFKTVYESGSGEITEKKSRFIATVFPVNDEESALQLIEQHKKQFWDATHNCYAYRIGDKNTLERCSDDGEPARTAGRPMLEILIGDNLVNVLVIVTRYFGGTLLGTGGLVRAYQSAVRAGLDNCAIIEKHYGIKLSITTDYTGIGKLQYICSGMNLPILESIYTDIVTTVILILPEEIHEFTDKITEATNGRTDIVNLGAQLFANLKGHAVLFEQ